MPKYQVEERKTRSRKPRLRAEPVPHRSTKSQDGNWQRNSCGDQRGDSSLTNAEREPSKMRRSLNEVRPKSKRNRTMKQRTPPSNTTNMRDHWETNRRFRMSDIQYLPNANESEGYVFHPASSGDMATAELRLRKTAVKSRLHSDQSPPLNQVAKFNPGEKQILRGGRFNHGRTKTAVVTRVSFDNIKPTKINNVTTRGRDRGIADEKKRRITQPLGVRPTANSRAPRKPGHYVIIKDPQDRAKGRQCRQRSPKPRTLARSEAPSRPRTKKKTRRVAISRSARPTENASPLRAGGRRSKSDTDLLPGE